MFLQCSKASRRAYGAFLDRSVLLHWIKAWPEYYCSCTWGEWRLVCIRNTWSPSTSIGLEAKEVAFQLMWATCGELSNKNKCYWFGFFFMWQNTGFIYTCWEACWNYNYVPTAFLCTPYFFMWLTVNSRWSAQLNHNEYDMFTATVIYLRYISSQQLPLQAG